MSLTCAIGQFVRPVFHIIPGNEQESRYFPLDEAAVQDTIFSVGMGLTFRANNTGELICFANDAHNLYWNNKGKLEVTVTRLSWPPSNETYYQAMYLQSCDSAISVYNMTAKCNPSGGHDGWEVSNVQRHSVDYGIEFH